MLKRRNILSAVLFIYLIIVSIYILSALSPTIHISTQNTLPMSGLKKDNVGQISDRSEYIFDLTLENIFSNIIASENLSEESDYWTMLVTGDVMIGRSVNSLTVRSNDFNWAYRNIQDFLNKADITYINLESPVIENCPNRDDGMVFCGDVRHIPAMTLNGINIANLANNHAMDQGPAGLETTLRLLNENDILAVGYENPVYKDVKGIRIAFLGYTDISCYPNTLIACANESQIISELAMAKENSDLVIVQFHWGPEYQALPNFRQRELAYLAVDNGADLVLGNHPHWIQPLEIYNDVLIAYSHGNFIFDQMWSQRTREGIVIEYKFLKDKLIGLEFYPIIIDNFGQPRLLDGDNKDRIIEQIKNDSFAIEVD